MKPRKGTLVALVSMVILCASTIYWISRDRPIRSLNEYSIHGVAPGNASIAREEIENIGRGDPHFYVDLSDSGVIKSVSGMVLERNREPVLRSGASRRDVH